jgi:hypothetical protein
MKRNVYDDVMRGDRLPVKERTFSKDKGTDRENMVKTNYNDDINKAKSARNSQFEDTNPRIEKEGFLGMDDIDRMRRRKIDNTENSLL